MSGEELLIVNAGIFKTVDDNLIKYSPDTIFIIIVNPMDIKIYLTLK